MKEECPRNSNKGWAAGCVHPVGERVPCVVFSNVNDIELCKYNQLNGIHDALGDNIQLVVIGIIVGDFYLYTSRLFNGPITFR